MIGGWVSAGKVPTILTVGIGRSVGLVDDAERRLAARDQDERGAHAVRLGDLVLDAVPHAELLERRLAVLAGRHRVDIGHGKPAALEEGREIEAGLDVGR